MENRGKKYRRTRGQYNVDDDCVAVITLAWEVKSSS